MKTEKLAFAAYGCGILALMILAQPPASAADERTKAVLAPDRGPHGELKFDGTVEAVALQTHTLWVKHRAETRAFAIDEQTKLQSAGNQALKLTDFKKGDTVRVLYVAEKGTWKAREIRK